MWQYKEKLWINFFSIFSTEHFCSGGQKKIQFAWWESQNSYFFSFYGLCLKLHIFHLKTKRTTKWWSFCWKFPYIWKRTPTRVDSTRETLKNSHVEAHGDFCQHPDIQVHSCRKLFINYLVRGKMTNDKPKWAYETWDAVWATLECLVLVISVRNTLMSPVKNHSCVRLCVYKWSSILYKSVLGY